MGGFSFPYGFSFDMELTPDMMPELAGAGMLFVVMYLLVMFVVWAFCLVSYVLSSLGMYTIANRRGIRHAWLAWIPLGNLWILGSIADQYQYVAKGRIKNRRKILLGLSIGVVVAYVGLIIGMVTSMILSESVESAMVLVLLLSMVGMLAVMALAVTLTVYQYIAYYDLFSSSEPNNATLYLVLSIIFSVTLPFFVFACRKKDLGMPPRKQPAQPVVIPTVEPVVDPNVVEKVVIPTVEPVVESTTEPVAEGFAQPEEFEEE